MRLHSRQFKIRMSAEDYDQCEKLFCGTWTLDREENLEEFLTAAEISEQTKSFISDQKTVNFTRVGNSFLEKSTIDGIEREVTTKLNEEIEWKDKEENPAVHIKFTPTFEDGVWIQEMIPLTENDGKRRVFKGYLQGDEYVAELSLPDVPGVVAKRFYKKVISPS